MARREPRRTAWLAACLTLVAGLMASVAVRSQAPAAQLPEPNAAAVWQHLQTADYQNSWRLWPGTGAFKAGGEPHGMLLTTYVNAVGHAAIMSRTARMPRGTIIVKENYTPDKQLAAVTVMYKAQEGYDPEHNDWYWLKRQPDGTVDADGRVASCQGCHRSGTDYIRTPMEARRAVR